MSCLSSGQIHATSNGLLAHSSTHKFRVRPLDIRCAPVAAAIVIWLGLHVTLGKQK